MYYDDKTFISRSQYQGSRYRDDTKSQVAPFTNMV